MKATNVICPVCGKAISTPKNVHHVFNGAYKKKSEEDGFLVNMHPMCHRKLHDDSKIAKSVKILCQGVYEETHTRDEFIERYGKSYL